jgi:hypothetical protein
MGINKVKKSAVYSKSLHLPFTVSRSHLSLVSLCGEKDCGTEKVANKPVLADGRSQREGGGESFEAYSNAGAMISSTALDARNIPSFLHLLFCPPLLQPL